VALLSESDIEEQQCLCKCGRRRCGCGCCDSFLRLMMKCQPTAIRDRQVMLAGLLWALCGLAMGMYDSIFTTYLQTDRREGGIGFNTDQIGTLLAVQGGTFFAWNFLFYRRVANYLGPLAASAVGTFLLGVYAFGVPSAHFIATTAPPEVLWVALIALIMLRATMGTTQGTAATQIINNSARADNRGAVNGFGQSIGAFARTVAPLIGGALYSLSMDYQEITGHQFLVFLVIGALFWVASIMALEMPKSLNAPRVEKDKKTKETG